MSEYVILSSPYIIFLSLAVIVMLFVSFFTKDGKVKDGLYIVGFLVIAACIVYALLLGASLEEVLVYTLIYVLLAAVPFYFENKGVGKDKDKVDKAEKANGQAKPDGQAKDDGEVGK